MNDVADVLQPVAPDPKTSEAVGRFLAFPEVGAAGTLVGGPNAVFPVVAISKAAAGNRTTEGLILRISSTSSLRMPLMLGIFELSPTQMPS
jgi:hypothetical protein